MIRDVEGTFHALYVGDEPILYYGDDVEGGVFLCPTPYLSRHRLAFARWTQRNVHRWRGKEIKLQHDLSPEVERWARWLGCTVYPDVVIV